MAWTGPDVLAAAEGELVCGAGDYFFSGVSIDSRSISPSHLFVAVKGQKHDGHDFIDEVLKKGVAGFVIDKSRRSTVAERIRSSGGLCVAVTDTVKALGAMARYRRRQAGLIVVAITGTNGKTSTKEMTARVLEQRYQVLATAGNFNNEIGLPLTLLRLEASHQVGVLELGMNAPGEIARLTRICEPDIGVVLNIGEGHLAGLGNIEGVARAKGELIETMGNNGAAVLNADDPRVLKLAEKAGGRVVTFGQGDQGDVRAVRFRQTDRDCAFDLVLSDQDDAVPVQLKVSGRHLVSNALAAAAVGKLMDIPAQIIASGLERFVPVPGRMNVIPTRAGFFVVDDTYNANPGSMRAAIAALKGLRGRRRGLLVFGDMYELGDQSAVMHQKIGGWAAESGAAMIFAVGDFARAVAAGAMEAGMTRDKIVTGTREQIIKALSKNVRSGDWVLVKGSRAMAMETVAAAIVGKGGGPEEEKPGR
ncbi:MAG: UDP-N-acetylmuramoyl-tripeptide--D-alanyl-D-alanine ligase [Thermodesulfobacteriota bacterium]